MSMVVIIEEQIFVTTISCESYSRNTQTWESPFKSIQSSKWTVVAPCFSNCNVSVRSHTLGGNANVRAQGSFKGVPDDELPKVPDDCASLRGSNPVRLGLGWGIELL